jgi:hypothetical protein
VAKGNGFPAPTPDASRPADARARVRGFWRRTEQRVAEVHQRGAKVRPEVEMVPMTRSSCKTSAQTPGFWFSLVGSTGDTAAGNWSNRAFLRIGRDRAGSRRHLPAIPWASPEAGAGFRRGIPCVDFPDFPVPKKTVGRDWSVGFYEKERTDIDTLKELDTTNYKSLGRRCWLPCVTPKDSGGPPTTSTIGIFRIRCMAS